MKRSCLGGLIWIIFFVGAMVTFARVIVGAGPRTIKGLPSHFPATLLPYDIEGAQDITLVPGTARARATHIEQLFHRVLLGPIARYVPVAPIDDELTDTLVITWRDLTVTPDALTAYYTDTFTKAGFTITTSTPAADRVHFDFVSKHANGTLDIVDLDTQRTGTESTVLTVRYPAP